MPNFNAKRGDYGSQVLGQTAADDLPPDATFSKTTIIVFAGVALLFIVVLCLIVWMVMSSF